MRARCSAGRSAPRPVDYREAGICSGGSRSLIIGPLGLVVMPVNGAAEDFGVSMPLSTGLAGMAAFVVVDAGVVT